MAKGFGLDGEGWSREAKTHRGVHVSSARLTKDDVHFDAQLDNFRRRHMIGRPSRTMRPDRKRHFRAIAPQRRSAMPRAEG
jgi:hypothetical protein